MSCRQITTRFRKSHRAGDKLLPSVNGSGISQRRLVGNIVEAGRNSRADTAISLKDAEVEEIRGSSVTAAYKERLVMHGARVVSSDIRT